MIRGNTSPSSMEKNIPDLTLEDFFEVYKLLVKIELLENKSSIFGSQSLEIFAENLMICKYIYGENFQNYSEMYTAVDSMQSLDRI